MAARAVGDAHQHQLRVLVALREAQPGDGDENFRTGRRAQKMHGEGDRKTNLRKRDHKSTHLLEPPVHSALKGAYAILTGLEGGGGAAGS